MVKGSRGCSLPFLGLSHFSTSSPRACLSFTFKTTMTARSHFSISLRVSYALSPYLSDTFSRATTTHIVYHHGHNGFAASVQFHHDSVHSVCTLPDTQMCYAGDADRLYGRERRGNSARRWETTKLYMSSYQHLSFPSVSHFLCDLNRIIPYRATS